MSEAAPAAGRSGVHWRAAPGLALLIAALAVCDDPRAWVRVAQDPNYTIYVDTAFLHVRPYDIVEVWYRTDHAAPRLHNGQLFDREVVHALVRCRPVHTARGGGGIEYKVSQVDMTRGGGRTVSRQRTTEHELADQPWRDVAPDGAEQMAAQAACHFSRQRQSGTRAGR